VGGIELGSDTDDGCGCDSTDWAQTELTAKAKLDATAINQKEQIRTIIWDAITGFETKLFL
jgi:hypothetical protein